MKKVFFFIFKKIVNLFSGFGLGKLPLVNQIWPRINSVFLKHLRPESVRVGNHTMFLDKRDSLSLSVYGKIDSLETEILKKILKKGDVVLDIGSNIGYYTLIAADCVGETGQVFAFEPDPSNFDLLQKNIRVNNYSNVTLVQKAVANENGSTKLFLSTFNNGDHRLYDSSEGRDSIIIDVVRLDDFFADFKRPINFIKIDIQGAEEKAFQGMKNLLQNNQELNMIVEFWPYGLNLFGTDPEIFLKNLNQYNFNVYHLDEETESLQPLNREALLAMYTAKNERGTNILCLRNPLPLP